jgi:GNAT superfamily N-acetyltransferase
LEHGGLGGWLEELYVVPEFRGAGLGSQLLEATIQECAQRGCQALDLEVESDHERVETLYQRFGFTPLPTRRRWVRKLQTERR